MTSVDTSTTSAAKEHARAQSGVVTDSMPVVPASSWPTPPSDIDPALLTWAETVPGGRYTTKVLGRGTRLRLRDLDGRACAHLLLYRADAPWERLNVADTVKVPWQAYLGAGHPLLSDQGRVLATLVSDGSGRHDALCGTTSLASNTARYGDGSLHSASPAGRELFTVAAAKHGLERRDLPPSLSFFHGVRVGEDGSLSSIGSAGADTIFRCTGMFGIFDDVLDGCQAAQLELVVDDKHALEPMLVHKCLRFVKRGAFLHRDEPFLGAS